MLFKILKKRSLLKNLNLDLIKLKSVVAEYSQSCFKHYTKKQALELNKALHKILVTEKAIQKIKQL